MSKLTQHRAGTPSAKQEAKFVGFRREWSRNGPIIVIGKDAKRQSAKRYRKHVIVFQQWCAYIRTAFGLPISNDKAVENVVAKHFPKFKNLVKE